MKILICGDSFCVPDPKFPLLHWSEKIAKVNSDYHLDNIAIQGCTNAQICLQLNQGIKFLKPDFVIISFTQYGRYEIDTNINPKFDASSAHELKKFYLNRYHTNMYDLPINKEKIDIINSYQTLAASENFEKLKNYFFIEMILSKLTMQGIPFCFSLGGFYFMPYYDQFLQYNHVDCLTKKYPNQLILTNLWNDRKSELANSQAIFHNENEQTQSAFASECVEHLRKISV